MENIENSLKNYRLRQRRQEKVKHIKDNIKGFLMFGVKDNNAKVQPNITSSTIHVREPVTEVNLSKPLNGSIDTEIGNASDGKLSEEEVLNESADVIFNEPESLVLKYTLRTVYIAFWITLYIIAIELQFGIVFLMFSAIVGIYLNTRTGPKKRNEISAYSVFNKNCESIDGTLKPEQFEREIGIR